MSGEIMVGTCQVCGKKDVPLTRKYFYYDVKCLCCSPKHFEMVEHCEDCIPVEPEEVEILMSTEELKKIHTGACEHVYEYMGKDSGKNDILKCIKCGCTTKA